MQTDITKNVVEAIGANGFVTSASLASSIGCSRDQIVDASDEIEASGLKLMRVRGSGGAAQFVGKRMRKAPEATASINPAWLTNAMVCLRRPTRHGGALLARADFFVNEAIRRFIGSYRTAHVSPAKIERSRADARRARDWDRRTIVFGDPDWVEPRRHG